MRVARLMSVVGLSLAVSGCDLFNPDPDSVGAGGYCRETAQCIDDLVCLDFACVDVGLGGADTGGDTPQDTGSPNDGTCLPVGEFCTNNFVCCSAICVIDDQRCAQPCINDSECSTGCCAELVGGGKACADASFCAL